MNEFDIIDTFFKPQDNTRDDVVIDIGDDAAQIAIASEERILTVDIISLSGNQHFYGPDYGSTHEMNHKPAHEHKSGTKFMENALTVKIESLLERNVTPCWLTVALTLPEQNSGWLQEFSQGLLQLTSAQDIQVIGGDTTHGPFALTIHLLGYSGHV
jgi:thiamine-monophosphate kinase